MNNPMDLPPSVNVGPRAVGVSIFTAEGVTVEVVLPRPGGLGEMPRDELIGKARELARAALKSAAISLAG